MSHIYLAPCTVSLMDADTLCWDSHHRSLLESPIIDLRPVSAQAEEPGLTLPQGYYFGVYDRQVVIPGATYFGESLINPMTARQLGDWKGLLNIDETLVGNTISDVLWSTLTLHSQSSGVDRVRPLMPSTRTRQLSLQLPGLQRTRTISEQADEWASVISNLQLIYEDIRNAVLSGDLPADYHRRLLSVWCEKYGISTTRYAIFIPSGLPNEGLLPHETTFTESWPTDGTLAAQPNQDQTWANVSGTSTVASGELTHTTGSTEADARCATTLSTDDHYNKVNITGVQVAGEHPFITVRYSASAQTYYAARWNDGDYQLFKRVSGSFTSLDTATVAEPSVAYSFYLEFDGSSYSVEQPESTVHLNGTDTAITGNTQIGIRTRNDNHKVGSLEAADLAAAADEGIRHWQHQRSYPRGVMSGVLRGAIR